MPRTRCLELPGASDPAGDPPGQLVQLLLAPAAVGSGADLPVRAVEAEVEVEVEVTRPTPLMTKRMTKRRHILDLRHLPHRFMRLVA